MARLIDAEPILMRWNTESLGRREMYDIVKNAPAIDIVQCKDCASFHYSGMGGDNGILYCTILLTEMQPTDFCSYGERKDDELQEDDGRCEVPCSE